MLQSAFVAEGSTLLIFLAGAVLLYSSFREKYLLPWIAGWSLYGTSKLVALGASFADPRLWIVAANVSFALSVGLLACSILIYVHRRKLLWPCSIATFTALLLGIASFWSAQSGLLYWSFRGCCLLVLAIAVFWLVRFSLGRYNPGHWIVAVNLLLLPVDWRPLHALMNFDIFVDLLLGIGIMLIVLNDSRIQVARLNVLNTITHEISGRTDFVSIAEIVLTEIRRHTRARAACFWILQKGEFVLEVQQGLPDLLAAEAVIRVQYKDQVHIARVRDMSAPVREAAAVEGIRHLLLIPVRSKSSEIGILALGMPGYRAYTEYDKDFLKAATEQLGLAAENRGLVQQLVRSRNEWASTFNSIPDYIFVHDRDFRIVRANRALLSRLKLSRTRVIHQSCENVLPGAGTNWTSCPYCGLGETATSSEEDPCFGGYSVVSTSAYTGEEDASSGSTVHVIKDITEAKAAEERYRMLFSHMQEGIFVATPEGKIIDCNDAFAFMLGYKSRDEALKSSPAEFFRMGRQDQQKYASEMAEFGFVRNFEYSLRCRDGRVISVIESSFATLGMEGRIERYQGVLLDVTEIKRAEDEVRRRNRELYVLNNIAVALNQSFDLDEILELTIAQITDLFSTDTAAVYIFNEQTSSMQKRASWGHRSSWVTETRDFILPPEFLEMIRGTRAEIISHEDLPRLPELVHKFVEAENLQSWLWVVLWRKDRILGLLCTSSRFEKDFSSSDESVMTAVGRQLATTIDKVQLYDETRQAYDDLRRTQEQLLQSEKMSAVGQLISGVAHELNNPLTAILGYAQLLESEQLDPRIQEFILKLHKQAQRTQKIVQNLLSFARQHKPQKLHVDLCRVVEEAIALRDYDLKVHNIRVEREFSADVPVILGDPFQIEQVCLNIINNAADAMMEAGAGGQLRVRIFTQHAYVVTEFHDSGPGFAEPRRVLDPFYTTKGVGKGTGLGLSICYGIAKEHGGEILVYNHPSGGAAVQVRLPVAVGEKPATEEERITARRESRIEGQILLLDDEEDVPNFEPNVLTAAGLSVDIARSDSEALEKLKHGHFDVIFLDSKVPGQLGEVDICQWIQQQRPDLISRMVLVVSNMSEPKVIQLMNQTHIPCLVKPFELSDLFAVIRRLMRKNGAVAQG